MCRAPVSLAWLRALSVYLCVCVRTVCVYLPSHTADRSRYTLWGRAPAGTDQTMPQYCYPVYH